MTGRHDIWARLREHEILPPKEVSDQLRARLDEERGKDGSEWKGNIERLGQYEIIPPPELHASIVRLIGTSAPRASTRTIPTIRIAAACLLAIAGAWIIYQSTISRRPAVAVIKREKTPTANLPPTLTHQSSPSSSGDSSPASVLRPGNKNIPATAANPPERAGKYRRHTVFSIEDQNLPLVDNDLLVSFASFTPNTMPHFIISDEKENLKLRVDQYTNITISKPMLKMIKEMNQFKSNGNLKGKARRTRGRLDKWKKADEDWFDRSRGKNPLDPIDLANFIFK